MEPRLISKSKEQLGS